MRVLRLTGTGANMHTIHCRHKISCRSPLRIIRCVFAPLAILPARGHLMGKRKFGKKGRTYAALIRYNGEWY